MNRMKYKNHIISIDTETAFDKIQHLFIIKILNKLVIEGTYLNTEKAIHDKLTARFMYEKSWKHIHLILEPD